MKIRYNGTFYSGWQVQPDEITVQGEIEEALSIILKGKVKIVGSGRTDSGVHARKQVAHFDCDKKLDTKKTEYSLNGILPQDIAISNLKKTDDDFHARFSAKRRIYRYFFSTDKPAILSNFIYHWPYKMDMVHFCSVFHLFEGEKDYSSFAKNIEGKNSICNIYNISITKKYDVFMFEIEGNRFLHGMVRAILGTLLLYERGKLTSNDIKHIFEGKNRQLAGPSVPASGLILWDVKY
ncbi:MAG: tRNA pseudouridine(38-40) synthase TruA [Proteobacteria bacterium]|nr:tRNA pseudouridine(38-40) synthase TruA [Pseudomonadota bacterium]